MKTQTIQDSVFALGQTLMIPTMLQVAVLKIQTALELAVGLLYTTVFNFYTYSIFL